jgi:hypothetical protein
METLIVVSKDDLRQMLREIIREELSQLVRQEKPTKLATEDILLTRAETAKLLHVSLVTLTDWVRRGLPARRSRRRGRVLFIKAEVLNWLQKNRNLKSDSASE